MARDFGVFRGDGGQPGARPELPEPPSWRRWPPADTDPYDPPAVTATGLAAIGERQLDSGQADPVDMVNAAIVLRRPLLVTGLPGSGKSTLATMIATELSLGSVLTWSITSRSTLRDGLYDYDAIGRLQAENPQRGPGHSRSQQDERTSVGKHVTLGPLGTALLPWTRPRVLLIDEFDKCDIDLPSDLLHVFEEGEFGVRELERLPGDDTPVKVFTSDRQWAPISNGRVRCAQFPIVIMTSNQERTFPPAFMRRCLQLRLGMPTRDTLQAIIDTRIGDVGPVSDEVRKLIEQYKANSHSAIDQLLNAIYLVANIGQPGPEVLSTVLADLGREQT